VNTPTPEEVVERFRRFVARMRDDDPEDLPDPDPPESLRRMPDIPQEQGDDHPFRKL
jgi:hypothetical protein